MVNSLSHNIPETELIFRVMKWVSLCRQKKAETEVEPFPEIKTDSQEVGLISKGLDFAKKGAAMAGQIAESGAGKRITQFVPGAGMALNIIQWAAGGGKQKLKHTEIKEIAMRYLLILEMESRELPHLQEKYEELRLEFERNCKEAESKKSWF
jgi:hypothetical protein